MLKIVMKIKSGHRGDYLRPIHEPSKKDRTGTSMYASVKLKR